MTTCHDPIIDRLFVQATVRQLKPSAAITISPRASLDEAIAEMTTRSVGSLLIADQADLLGIVTERDILVRAVDRDLHATSVDTIMTKDPRTVPAKISVARIVYEMATVACRHLVVKNGAQLEVVSSTDVMEYLARVENGPIAILAGPLRDLLEAPLGDSVRGSLVTVSGNHSVETAWQMMCSRRKGCVAVVNPQGSTLGVFSERDLVRSVLAPGLDPKSTTVEKMMTPRPRTLPHTSSWGLAIGLMAEKHFRHIPVVDDSERAIGMVSVRDCFDRLAEIVLKSIS
jgi:CBS domain-containing protein